MSYSPTLDYAQIIEDTKKGIEDRRESLRRADALPEVSWKGALGAPPADLKSPVEYATHKTHTNADVISINGIFHKADRIQLFEGQPPTTVYVPLDEFQQFFQPVLDACDPAPTEPELSSVFIDKLLDRIFGR